MLATTYRASTKNWPRMPLPKAEDVVNP